MCCVNFKTDCRMPNAKFVVVVSKPRRIFSKNPDSSGFFRHWEIMSCEPAMCGVDREERRKEERVCVRVVCVCVCVCVCEMKKKRRKNEKEMPQVPAGICRPTSPTAP